MDCLVCIAESGHALAIIYYGFRTEQRWYESQTAFESWYRLHHYPGKSTWLIVSEIEYYNAATAAKLTQTLR